MAYVPEYDAPFNRGVERGKELSRASIRERDARITRLEADKAVLSALLNEAFDFLGGCDGASELRDRILKSTRIQGDDDSNGLGGGK